MRGIHLKRKLKYTERTAVVASWLLHHNWQVRQYYSEFYNGSVLTSKIKSQNFVERNLLILENFSP